MENLKSAVGSLLRTKEQRIRCLVFAANCHVNLCANCAVCRSLIFLSLCLSDLFVPSCHFHVVALSICLAPGSRAPEHLHVGQLHAHSEVYV